MKQHVTKLFVCFLCICSMVIIACTAQAASSRLPEEVIDVFEAKWPDWQIPTVTYKASDGKHSTDNTPASYYYDEHGHTAAFAVLSKDGRNRLVIMERKGGTWKVVGNSTYSLPEGWETQSEVYYSFFFKPETGYTWRVIFWKTGNASYPSGVVDMDALTGNVQRVAKTGTMPNEFMPYPDRF